MKHKSSFNHRPKRRDSVLYPITLSVPGDAVKLIKSQICAYNAMYAQGYKFVPEFVVGDADITLCRQDELCDFYGRETFSLAWDNGYFLYYDKRYIGKSSLTSLESIVNDCKNNKMTFSFALQSSPWYASSFMLATGCKSEWQFDGKQYLLKSDNCDGKNGFIAAKAIHDFMLSGVYKNSSSADDFALDNPSAAVVAGPWEYKKAKKLLGDNLGVCELPCFKYKNKSYHLGSVSGGRYYALRDFDIKEKSDAVHSLLAFLTSAPCQKQNYRILGYLPVDKKIDICQCPMAIAFFAQDKYAVPQMPIHPYWWRIAGALTNNVYLCKSDDEIKRMLTVYSTAIKGLLLNY